MHWQDIIVVPQKTSFLEGRYTPILEKLLACIGIESLEAAELFLHPRLAHLDDPFLLKNLDLAVGRILQALQNKHQVCILGDYDVDGVTSTALLVSVLRYLDGSPLYFVPRRSDEGYGLSIAVLKRALLDTNPHLVIALDCGTNSVEEVHYLRERNIDVIIIDHHRSKDSIPHNCIIVNPHLYHEENHPLRTVCSVGLVFKLVHGLIKKMRELGDFRAEQIKLREYLDLVAMGTVADLVPLLGDNRVFTRFGLEKICKAERLGVKALLAVAGVQAGAEITPTDISFKLGPRINASGRLADAVLPVEMLLSTDYSTCLRIAYELNDMNRERQEIEKIVAEEAEKYVEANQKQASGLVAFSPDWHSGVVGIVAGKLSRKYYRPAIVLGVEDSLAKGSGRSIEGINLVEILSECSQLLASWGGHPMAVGVSLPIENLEKFQIAFSSAVAKKMVNGLQEPVLKITSWIKVQDIQEQLMTELSFLMPFGEGNPEPIFGIKNIRITAPPGYFGENHYRFQIQSGPFRWISGIAWKQAARPISYKRPVDIAIKLRWNSWSGKRTIQAELIDWRYTEEI